MEMISYKFNKMYLYGQVNSSGKLLHQFQQINVTVLALSENCEGRIECLPEIIKVVFSKLDKYKQRQASMVHSGKRVKPTHTDQKPSGTDLNYKEVHVIPRRKLAGSISELIMQKQEK